MLSVSNVTLSYGGRVLLRNVSFDLEPGCIMGLVAPNGYGKTTLLKAMADIKAARVSGSITVDSLPANQVARRRARVFYAPGEGTLLYPGMTVGEHLDMAKKLWCSVRSVEDVSRLCRVDGFLNKRVRACSQGMRQQLTLAIAYMTGARYLLLDEPMNALDPTNVQLNSDIMRSLARRGTGIIMSSHILDNVDQLSDKILFVKNAGLVLFDPAAGAGAAEGAGPDAGTGAAAGAGTAAGSSLGHGLGGRVGPGAHFASGSNRVLKAIDIYNELYL